MNMTIMMICNKKTGVRPITNMIVLFVMGKRIKGKQKWKIYSMMLKVLVIFRAIRHGSIKYFRTLRYPLFYGR